MTKSTWSSWGLCAAAALGLAFAACSAEHPNESQATSVGTDGRSLEKTRSEQRGEQAPAPPGTPPAAPEKSADRP